MKISIITATFNSGKTLRYTFESIIHQTYKNYEVVVKDGGSKDDTIQIIKEYEEKFRVASEESGGNISFRWVSEPDKGIYDAMNKGIAMATGDVVGLLNSDDYFGSDHVLINIYRHLKYVDEVDAVYADVLYVDANDLTKVIRRYSSRVFRPWLMRLGFMPAHPTFYCRKCIYEKFAKEAVEGVPQYFDTSYKIAADFENLLRMIFVGRIRTEYVPQVWVLMRDGGASSSGAESHKQINRDHMRAFRENGVYSNYLLISLRYLYKVGELIRGWWLLHTYGAWLMGFEKKKRKISS